MKTFKQYTEACWTGYKRKKGTEAYEPGSCVKEDGMGAGAVSAGPTNAVSSGSIAGSGGKGGEPGVSKKRNPVMKPMGRRNPPNMG